MTIILEINVLIVNLNTESVYHHIQRSIDKPYLSAAARRRLVNALKSMFGTGPRRCTLRGADGT